MMNAWNIVGHDWAVDLLSRRLEADRIGHAYLFAGPAGLGKALFARRLAQAINCVEPTPPCGVCRSCELIARGQHPDLHLIEPENEKIKIEVIRELHNVLSMRPFEARFRVAIIHRLDRATESAMDALLKTLEEPPSMSKLILTADVGETLLPTIVSRCQVIPLRPVPAVEIESALTAHFDLPADAAASLARLSGGRPGWAIRAAESPEAQSEHTQILDALVGLLRSNRAARFAYAEELARYDNLKPVLELWQSYWRDVMLLAEGSRVAPIHSDRTGELQEVAYAAGPEAARRALIAVRDTIHALSRNANGRLALEVMLLDFPYV